MYVCICHAVSDREIRRNARESEVRSAAQYFRTRGVRPRCGKCVAYIHALIAGECGSRADMRAEADAP